jgi:leucyl-tRNA synthetase
MVGSKRAITRSDTPHITMTTTTSAEQGMADMSLETAAAGTAAAPGKAFVRRDALLSNERLVQQAWEEAHVFEANPSDNESFLVTFPYPYANGHLHIGHAFSFTKAVFRAQFERHNGKNVLLPFAFHCTGMPIQAVCIDGMCEYRE